MEKSYATFPGIRAERAACRIPPGIDAIKECEKAGLSTKPMVLRLVRIEPITGEVEILITSLIDDVQYPHDLFADLYHLRWPVEEAYKLLKCRIEIGSFSGKSLLAVRQDFFAHILMFNLTSMLIAPIDYKLKISTTKNKWDYKVNSRTRALTKNEGYWNFDVLSRFHTPYYSEITRTVYDRAHRNSPKQKVSMKKISK